MVEIRPREGLADPEGSTIQEALPSLGFDDISSVTAGRAIRLVVEAEDEERAISRVREACTRFLVNPVTEESEIMAVSPVAAEHR